MPLFTMLLTTFVTLARLPATFATLLTTFVTFWFVWYSCEPFTASVLQMDEMSPAVRFVILVPPAPLSVICVDAEVSYVTALGVTSPPPPPLTLAIAAFSWSTLTASVPAAPAVTLTICLVYCDFPSADR